MDPKVNRLLTSISGQIGWVHYFIVNVVDVQSFPQPGEVGKLRFLLRIRKLRGIHAFPSLTLVGSSGNQPQGPYFKYELPLQLKWCIAGYLTRFPRCGIDASISDPAKIECRSNFLLHSNVQGASRQQAGRLMRQRRPEPPDGRGIAAPGTPGAGGVAQIRTGWNRWMESE